MICSVAIFIYLQCDSRINYVQPIWFELPKILNFIHCNRSLTQSNLHISIHTTLFSIDSDSQL